MSISASTCVNSPHDPSKVKMANSHSKFWKKCLQITGIAILVLLIGVGAFAAIKIIQTQQIRETSTVSQIRVNAQVGSLELEHLTGGNCQTFQDDLEEVDTLAKEDLPTWDSEALHQRYTKLSIVGAGGEGVVFKVFEKGTGTIKALKIGNNCGLYSQQRHAIASANMLLNQQLTPHFTRVYQSFLLSTIRHYDFVSQNPFEIVKAPLKETVPIIRKGLLMEFLDGDLEKIWHGMPYVEKLSSLVQIASAEHLLNRRFGVQVVDASGFMLRNVFFKRLTETDLFRGKKLIDYDFWRYAIGERIFYLPRPQLLIKLGDYDQWECSSCLTSLEKQREIRKLRGFQKPFFRLLSGITETHLEQLFQLPNTTVSILELT